MQAGDSIERKHMSGKTKVCSPTKGCGIEKDISEFSKSGTNKSGSIRYRFNCSECRKKTDKQYYENNLEKVKKTIKQYKKTHPDKVKELKNRYIQNNPEQIILTDARSRARRKGFEFNIEVEDIFIPEYCPVLGIKLEYNKGKNIGVQPNSASIDRIDSSKGYVKGNVRIISWRANDLKSDATINELEKVLEDLRRLQEGKEVEGWQQFQCAAT